MILPPPLVARFRADLARLAVPDGRVGIAVSGGPDSLALLLLALAERGDSVLAATVDHGLRPESASEAAMVADLCARIGCPHTTLTVSVRPGGEGLQGEARRARYRALGEWARENGVETVMTAHHADDQAETILMRLQRGAGLPGLSGIRAVRREGVMRIVRPVLGWRRAELAAIIETCGVVPVDDPANRNPRFDRARIRYFLAANPQFDVERIARSAAAIGEADAALDWMVDKIAADRLRPHSDNWVIDPAGLPRDVRRRLLRRAIAALHAATDLTPAWTGQEDVDGLLGALEAGQAGTLAGVMAKGGEQWRIAPAPPRRNTRQPASRSSG